jgi:hypothetical protein
VEQTNDPRVIERKLGRIRRQKRVGILLLVGFIPIGILSAMLHAFFHVNFFLLTAFYFGLVIVWTIYIALTGVCPRCNQLYYWRMEGKDHRNFLTRHCLNCGLDLYAKEHASASRAPVLGDAIECSAPVTRCMGMTSAESRCDESS